MNEFDRPTESTPYDPSAPLPNRFTRATLIGCLGILCVLTLPALLFIPVEQLSLPAWLARLVPLVGVGAAALGSWLLGRVPADAGPRVRDPLHPLTGSGRPPVVERPATTANRISLAVVVTLAVCCAVGYCVVTFSVKDRGLLSGTVLTSVAGAALLVVSLLAVVQRAPVPAWRWVRLPLGGGPSYQALPPGLIGFIALAWALLLAAGAGYVWAPLGVGALILGGALAGPALQRMPRTGRTGRERMSR